MKRLWKFELTLDDGQTLYVGADGNPDSASMFEGEEGDAAREAVRRVCEFEAVHGVTPASVRYESHGKANAPAHRPPVGCTVTPDVRKEIDVDTKPYKEKYAKRKHGRNMAYPPGGEDVHRLCDTVDRLIWLLREIQAELPTDGQNEVERRLWNI